jgi:hypothetical protein
MKEIKIFRIKYYDDDTEQVKKRVWYLNGLEWDGKLTDEFLIND